MKKTKESNILIELGKDLSDEDITELKKIANGRKFCKIGERLIDICTDEIERYNYDNTDSIIIKIFKANKFNNKKNKYILENKINSTIRAIASDEVRKFGDDDDEEIEINEILKEVKDDMHQIIEYNNESSNIINMQTKKEA